ncbi:MAG TPA: ParA family protein [Ohtaekwangia sp.]|uniref:ParA family protein n=1 Tax=Ohtaekwangia sp. TaxID=2066019 RepID=UPI002F92B0E0
MVISIVNHKGGTGKTTTTLNLGAALARLGLKILVVDLDAQGNLGYSLGIPDTSYTLRDVLFEEVTLDRALVTCEGMQVLPANIQLADLERSLAKVDIPYYFLRDLLQQSAAQYDFILLDCPPSLSLVTVNALCASRHVVIPLQLEVLSVRGLELMMNSVNDIKKTLHPALSVLGILPVLVDKRKNLNHEVIEHIRDHYQLKIFDSHIRANVKASEAPSFGKSILAYAPTSTSAKDYILFADEFLKTLSPYK